MTSATKIIYRIAIINNDCMYVGLVSILRSQEVVSLLCKSLLELGQNVIHPHYRIGLFINFNLLPGEITKFDKVANVNIHLH